MIDIGLMCRCLDCCCPEGQGHRHPLYQEYLDELERQDHEAWKADGGLDALREDHGRTKDYLTEQAEMLREQARYPGGQG